MSYDHVVWCLDCNTRRLSSQRECAECLKCKQENETIGEIFNPVEIGDDFTPSNTDEVLIHIDDALGSLCRALVVAVEVDFCPIHNAISDLKRFQLSLRKGKA